MNTFTFGTAVLEITLMLLGAFILGAATCSLLKKLGICCKNTLADEQSLFAPTPTVPEATKEPLGANRNDLAANSTPHQAEDKGSGYVADIDSLLRSNSDPDATPTATKLAASSSRATGGVSIADLLKRDVNRVDDLKKLIGIDDRIERLLRKADINNFDQLTVTDHQELRAILEKGGKAFSMQHAKTWPYQAELAAKQDWERLDEYQSFLKEQ